MTVLFASETGNSKALAKSLVEKAKAKGIEVRLADMADYKTRGLKDEQDLLVIASTHGEGDAPQTAVGFFEFLESRKAPKLPQLRYAVLALGDSTYERYCEAGKRIDRRLEELGAQRLARSRRLRCRLRRRCGRLDCSRRRQPCTGHTNASVCRGNHSCSAERAPATTFDKKHPFQAAVIDNIVLTGRGSTKETRHIELSLADSGLTYQPGDALGIVPSNDPALVAAMLEKLSLSADTPVTVKQGTTSLGEALCTTFEITAVTPRFLDHWADITGGRRITDVASVGSKGSSLSFPAQPPHSRRRQPVSGDRHRCCEVHRRPSAVATAALLDRVEPCRCPGRGAPHSQPGALHIA